MKLIMRNYQNEEDYWRIRAFLRQIMILNGSRELSWHVARFDYWWWFVNPHIEKITPEENIFIWETEDGQIAAVLNPEGRGQAFLQVRPELHTTELDEEMIAGLFADELHQFIGVTEFTGLAHSGGHVAA